MNYECQRVPSVSSFIIPPSSLSRSMQIRAYQRSDLDQIKALTTDGFVGVSIDHGIEERFGPLNGHDWRWRKARHIDEDVARDPAGVFIAEDDGQIVGYITTWQDRE